MIFKELDGGLSVIDNLKVAGAKEGKLVKGLNW